MALNDSVFPCETCGRPYNHSVLKVCPGCAGAASPDTAKRAPRGSVSYSAPASQGNQVTHAASIENSQVAVLLTSLIEETRRNTAAANRTTYAVRAMVSFAVILLITILIGGVFGLLSLLWVGFAVIGGLVVLGGYIFAIVTLIREWLASYVPGR